MYAFISTAMIWVTAQFGYAGALPAPTVQWASQQQMVQVAGATDPDMRQWIREHSLQLGGLYIPDADKIYMHEELDFDDPRTRSVLVHELVHYVQDQLNVVGSTRQLEDQAYALQARWLQEHGGQ